MARTKVAKAGITTQTEPTKALTIHVRPYEWGKLCEESLVLGCTPEEALETFLTDTSALMNWDPVSR